MSKLSIGKVYACKISCITPIRIVIVFVNQKEMEHELKEDTQAAKAKMRAAETQTLD